MIVWCVFWFLDAENREIKGPEAELDFVPGPGPRQCQAGDLFYPVLFSACS